MTRDDARGLGWFAGFLIFMACVVALASVMGCGATTRHKTISAALTTTDTTCRAFKAYSLLHEKAIVTKDADEATARADLDRWRAGADKVFSACDGAYRAVAVAATLDDDHSIGALAAAAKILVDELRDLGVKLP